MTILVAKRDQDNPLAQREIEVTSFKILVRVVSHEKRAL
jgi:hypothetical protein